MTADLFEYAESRQYPETPGFKVDGTSRAAAVAMEPCAATMRALCMDALQVGEFTADEVAEKLVLSVLSIRPRISELKKQGKIEPTGERRRNQSGMSAAVMRIRK